MRPYTLADAETELAQALTRNDPSAIGGAVTAVDRLDTHRLIPDPLASALWYAAHGLHVFPCRPGSKTPATPHGCKDATLNDATINEWWRLSPTANVAIATGWLVDVVDFDGEAAHVEWGRHAGQSWGGLHRLGSVSTPRPGGLHLYVPQRTGARNGASIVPGVDYRALGGYVVAPPSTLDDRADQHPGTYRWLFPPDLP